jgi:hypothetical protein
MDEFEECDDAEDMYGPMQSAEADEDCWTPYARRDVEMIAKVDHIIAAVRSMETMHTAHAERRGRNQPSR